MAEETAEWVTRAPAGPLRPYVDRYLGYRLKGFPPGLHRGLPSRHMTLIASIGEDIDVAVHPDSRQAPQRYGCVLAGLQASPALIAHDGDQEGVAIELTPLGSRALAGMPAAELWALSVELSEAVGPVGGELWERLQAPMPWEQRFELCDQVLSGLVAESPVDVPLRRCWQALVASGGRVPVGELAAATGWSRQHLTRRFRREFGAAPKLAARIIRFERARKLLQSGPPWPRLAEVALECGYYDQAHLNRDFALLAGCSPTRLLEEEVPSFQDPEAGDL